MISIEVAGEPAPKGSMRAMLVRGRAMMIPGGSSANQRALHAWAKAVSESARASLGDRGPIFVDVAVEAHCVFRLPRPASHYGRRGTLLPSAPPDHWHIVKPDGDKLLRATLDALTGIVFDDDARIPISGSVKQWCHRGKEGAVITMQQLQLRPGRIENPGIVFLGV